MRPSSKSKAFAECCKIPDLATLALYLGSDYKDSKKSFCMDKKIDLHPEQIEYSWKDKKKGITLPKYLSEDLAYLVGVHIGDGTMGIYRRPRQVEYRNEISGHDINDKLFYSQVLVPLFKKVFNFSPKTRLNSPGCCGLYFTSKAMTTFFNQCLDLPLGKKSSIIDIPKFIQDAGPKYYLPCIGGIFDTDFILSFKNKNKTIHNYPIIELCVNSSKLVLTISKLLLANGISNFMSKRIVFDPRFKDKTTQFSVTASGKKNLQKWFHLIGSRNPSYLSRYAIYKKFGFCPPYTNYDERRRILLGKIDPRDYYGQREI